jgi:hypothetical protein
MMNTSDTEEYDEPTEEPPADNPPIEREEKSYSKFIESIFGWPLMLIIAILIAGAVTWLIATSLFTKPSPPPSEDASTSPATATESKTATDSSSKNQLKPAEEPLKPAPPPPEVYWSVISGQLLELEQERVAFLSLLGQKSPQPLPEPNSDETQHHELEKITQKPKDNNDSEASWLSTPKTVQKDPEISWTTVSQQLLELEQQREQTFTLLANKIKTNNE